MKTYKITVNGKQYDVTVEETDGQAAVTQNTHHASEAPAPKATPPKSAGPVGSIEVKSPLPGSIFKLPIKMGDSVKKGQVIIIIEAMKMENEVMAPSDGTIASVNVSEGSSVNTGDLLLTMD